MTPGFVLLLLTMLFLCLVAFLLVLGNTLVQQDKKFEAWWQKHLVDGGLDNAIGDPVELARMKREAKQLWIDGFLKIE